jgi:hypothetical protein
VSTKTFLIWVLIYLSTFSIELVGPGYISGIVTDQSNAMVHGANIVIVSLDMGFTSYTKTSRAEV